jgi:hypothetical protein
MSLTILFLAGNNWIIPRKGELGTWLTFFLHCSRQEAQAHKREKEGLVPGFSFLCCRSWKGVLRLNHPPRRELPSMDEHQLFQSSLLKSFSLMTALMLVSFTSAFHASFLLAQCSPHLPPPTLFQHKHLLKLTTATCHYCRTSSVWIFDKNYNLVLFHSLHYHVASVMFTKVFFTR